MPTFEMPPCEDLGNAIRLLRLARGLSLSGVADRSGVARAAIGAWEAGNHLPSGQALDSVLSVLGADQGLRSRLLAKISPRYAQSALRATPLGAPIHLGQLYRAMRLRRGLAQGQLAQTLGVGQAHLARWETGDLQLLAERREEFFDVLGVTEIERQALRSVAWETASSVPTNVEDRMEEYNLLPHAIQPIVLLGWEAELWRRACDDDAWQASLCQVVSLRANASLMNGEIREIEGLARRAIGLAKSTRQWQTATHAFYADRWRRRSKGDWAAEAQAMEEWTARLPDSQELAWTMACLGLAFAHLGHESRAISTTERALDVGSRHRVNRDNGTPIHLGEVWLALGEPERALEALGDCRFHEALHLRATALLELGEDVPEWLLEAAQTELGTRSWFNARQFEQIRRRIARRKGRKNPGNHQSPSK